MATSFIYRRNGRYYARLRIPKQYQAVYGRTHHRKSLGTADIAVARIRVHEVVLRWRREFDRLKTMLDVARVAVGSPLLLGEGLITIGSASRESGIAVRDLVQEVLGRKGDILVPARGAQGVGVASNKLEFDYTDGSFITNTADGLPTSPILAELHPRAIDVQASLAAGTFIAHLLFHDRRRELPVVFPHGIELPLDALLVSKTLIDSIRADLASGLTPQMIELAKSRPSAPAPSAASAPAAPRPAGMLVSELFQQFFAAMDPGWRPSTRTQMRGFCEVFESLMGDPLLDAIDRSMMRAFREAMMTLPHGLHLARRRFPHAAVKELAKLDTTSARISPKRADHYVAKVGEAFGWAVREELIAKNPAAGAIARKRRDRREQDERPPMSPENLNRIFSVQWFATGRGVRTAKGEHWSFQPFMYYLPLLALFTGGRLNELAQLYLRDVCRTPTGIWFLDFNLDGANKVNADEDDASDKSLKTVNAERRVPLHPVLVDAGLPTYAERLRDAGEDRLFPELRFDSVKGYGKAAGQWFNERFLGKKLHIARDGTQTFHSLRHNFVTALMHLDPPVGEFVVSQLAGHERGQTMSAKRYTSDAEPDKMLQHVARLAFNLPRIVPLDIDDALHALAAAKRRKQT